MPSVILQPGTEDLPLDAPHHDHRRVTRHATQADPGATERGILQARMDCVAVAERPNGRQPGRGRGRGFNAIATAAATMPRNSAPPSRRLRTNVGMPLVRLTNGSLTNSPTPGVSRCAMKYERSLRSGNALPIAAELRCRCRAGSNRNRSFTCGTPLS